MRFFLACAVLPLIALGVLAIVGARQEVGVILTGGGPHALLGAAWVAAWLASVIVSPIAAGAALVSLVFTRLHQAARATGARPTRS